MSFPTVKNFNFKKKLKIIFPLSHGQASVKRCSNENNVVLKQNQKHETVVLRMFIKSHMTANKLLPHTLPDSETG